MAGIAVQVRNIAAWYGTEFDQLEFRVISKEPVPITATGFKAHFVHRVVIDCAGGLEKYAISLLNDAARSETWIAYSEALRQLRVL